MTDGAGERDMVSKGVSMEKESLKRRWQKQTDKERIEGMEL